MGRILAVVNQKGGTAKTTTSVNLAAYIALSGRRVLLLDIDPQGSASSGTGIVKASVSKCMYDILINDVSIDEVKQKTSVNGLEIVPATVKLSGSEIELVNMMSREHRLKAAIDKVKNVYRLFYNRLSPISGTFDVKCAGRVRLYNSPDTVRILRAGGIKPAYQDYTARAETSKSQA